MSDLLWCLRLTREVGSGEESMLEISESSIYRPILCRGLDGVEVWNPAVSEEIQVKLLALAKKNSLLTIGGSDFKGMYSNPSISVGDCETPEAALKALMSYKTKMKKKKAASENK